MSAINVTSAGDTTLVSGMSGSSVAVYGFFFQCGVTCTVQFKSSSGLVLTGPMQFAGGGGMSAFWGGVVPIFTCNVADDLILNVMGVLPKVGGVLYYGFV